jgi:imidazolonepropionase-like amidohydrolase
LDALTRRNSTWAMEEEFNFKQVANDAANILRAGGLVGIGGHGELQGLGYHWELWAHNLGGLKPVEVLRAATIDGAKIIGVDQDLGSIEAGKVADMVILDKNPLENIRNSAAIHLVMKDGFLYEDDTLKQIWPVEKHLGGYWWWRKD